MWAGGEDGGLRRLMWGKGEDIGVMWAGRCGCQGKGEDSGQGARMSGGREA